jgi:predicted ATPase
MIKRLYIDGYKSFKNFEVELQPLSVIFGPNGSGKSNLIDAIQLLSALCTSKNITDAFKHHRGEILESFNYSDVGFDENMKKPILVMTFEIDIEISENTLSELSQKYSNSVLSKDILKVTQNIERNFKYSLLVGAATKTGFLHVISESLIPLNGNHEDYYIERNYDDIGAMFEPLGCGMFIGELGDPRSTVISNAFEFPLHPVIKALNIEMSKLRTYYLNPQVMRENHPVKDVRSLASDGSDIAPFLNVLRDQKPNAYNNLIRTLKNILPQKPNILIDRPKPGSLALKIEENGIPYSADLVSDGTLRVIGFLAAFRPENNSTLVAFEEPENGVHPVRLSQLADVINNMADTGLFQIIITTHSPILPKYFNNENLFVCGKDGNSTIVKPFVSLGSQYKDLEILENLDDRILRGDFGG